MTSKAPDVVDGNWIDHALKKRLQAWSTGKAHSLHEWSGAKAGDHVHVDPKRAALDPAYILVREDYIELYDGILEALSNPFKPVFIVAGQPGTGKSMAIECLIPWLMLADIPVKLVKRTVSAWFFQGAAVVCSNNQAPSWHDEFRKKRGVAIYDSRDFQEGLTDDVVDSFNGISLYITSPQANHTKRWTKRYLPTYFVSEVWSMEEVTMHKAYLLEKKTEWKASEPAARKEWDRERAEERAKQAETREGTMDVTEAISSADGVLADVVSRSAGGAERRVADSDALLKASEDQAWKLYYEGLNAADVYFIASNDYDPIALALKFGTDARKLFREWPKSSETFERLSLEISTQISEIIYSDVGVVPIAQEKKIHLGSEEPLITYLFINDHLHDVFFAHVLKLEYKQRPDLVWRLREVHGIRAAMFRVLALQEFQQQGIRNYEMREALGPSPPSKSSLTRGHAKDIGPDNPPLVDCLYVTAPDTRDIDAFFIAERSQNTMQSLMRRSSRLWTSTSPSPKLSPAGSSKNFYDVVFLRCTVANSHSFDGKQITDYLNKLSALYNAEVTMFRAFYIVVDESNRDAESGKAKQKKIPSSLRDDAGKEIPLFVGYAVSQEVKEMLLLLESGRSGRRVV